MVMLVWDRFGMVSSNLGKTLFQKSDVSDVVTVWKCHCCIVELCKCVILNFGRRFLGGGSVVCVGL